MSTETYETVGPKCPCCGYQDTADEAFYYDEGMTEMDCERCGKTFDVRVYTLTTWTCKAREGEGEQ